MSHFWTAYDGAESKKVGIYGGAGFVTMTDERIEQLGLPKDIKETFARSIDKVWDEEIREMYATSAFLTYRDIVTPYLLKPEKV